MNAGRQWNRRPSQASLLPSEPGGSLSGWLLWGGPLNVQ
jgi:hypothetical protein